MLHTAWEVAPHPAPRSYFMTTTAPGVRPPTGFHKGVELRGPELSLSAVSEDRMKNTFHGGTAPYVSSSPDDQELSIS